MKTVWFSLRRRLLALLIGGVSVAWLVTLAFSYVDAHHEVDELFDAQLAQTAQALLVLVGHEVDDDVEDMGSGAHKYQRSLHFQIWRADGQLFLRSNNAPLEPLTSSDGFSETRQADGHWRYFSQWNAEKTLQVQVSENHTIRDELIGHIAWRLLLPALFGLPLMGLWVWVATHRGLSSLDGIARQIASREPQQLQAVTPATAPEEIRPMLEALNGLFQRVDEALEAERRFTADAAHELRTPLAALQAQLQVALRARDDTERDTSLGQLQLGLVRAGHLVDQMLLLARLEPESGVPNPVWVGLSEIAESVCAELGIQILARNLEFDLQGDPVVQVFGQPDWLRVLIRNLVDNAVRYSPEGGKLNVVVEANADGVCLRVSDSGPGIPPDQREAVLKRFYRLHQGKQPGSGLGLAIVQRITELHRAKLLLDDSPDGGLTVSVRFQNSI
ncbi:MAG: hypothetical protein RIR18_183 [Pseudomonadota bacterium]|jgi:two-component system sensor histidine kinase QseC